MKSKLLNLGVLISSLFCYYEFNEFGDFIFQMEWETISKMTKNLSAGLHPFILIPMFGQLLLLITLFQKKPGRIITYLAIGCLGLLLLFMFLISIGSLNIKSIISFLPFIILSVLTIRHQRSIRTKSA